MIIREAKIPDIKQIQIVRNAVKENFNFKKIKTGNIKKLHIKDERNMRYMDWTAEKLMDKIDEKIQALKNVKKLNGGKLEKDSQRVSLKSSNLYFRMELMADFIYAKD